MAAGLVAVVRRGGGLADWRRLEHEAPGEEEALEQFLMWTPETFPTGHRFHLAPGWQVRWSLAEGGSLFWHPLSPPRQGVWPLRPPWRR